MGADDIPAAAAFIAESAEIEKDCVEATSAAEMLAWFNNPINHGRVLLAVAKTEQGTEGPIIGEVDYNHSPGIDHAWAYLYVHPNHRLQGVGTALYNFIDNYYRENDLPAPTYTPDGEATLLIDYLKRRGFEFDRYFWELELPAETEVSDQPELPEGITIRTFVPNQDEETLLEVRNVTFREHYGSVQRTLDEIKAITKFPHFRNEGLFFAFDGDKIAGFCLTAIHPDEIERRGYGIGHIDLLGTMPDYRGKGLGRALLLTGIHYLRGIVPVVELSVEGKNSNALALYYNVGFKQRKAYANMRQPQTGDEHSAE